jgi:hypothetical protein
VLWTRRCRRLLFGFCLSVEGDFSKMRYPEWNELGVGDEAMHQDEEYRLEDEEEVFL